MTFCFQGHQVCTKGSGKTLQKHLEIEEPTQVDRCLGRKHLFKRENGETEVYFDMVDFINSACQMYENLSGMPLKGAASPYLPEGSIPVNEWEERGALASDASNVLMKVLWAGRLARPDTVKAIGDLARRVTKWSRADDRRSAQIDELSVRDQRRFAYGAKSQTVRKTYDWSYIPMRTTPVPWRMQRAPLVVCCVWKDRRLTGHCRGTVRDRVPLHGRPQRPRSSHLPTVYLTPCQLPNSLRKCSEEKLN